jgi:lipoate-protein ligase A
MGSTSAVCRLIIDGAAEGATQMAIDEALLESAAGGGPATLRFYQWSQPTLSLGYFQCHHDRAAHRASLDCPLVRRPSGGGAIVHDRELTYSLTLPAAHPLAGDPTAVYEVVHEALVRALAAFRVQARRRGAASRADVEPFLCFERQAAGDVLLRGAKVCGSAQRRKRGAILQHGSLLLERSVRAPELPGIFDLAAATISQAELIAGWREELTRQPGLDCEPGELLPGETESARQLAREKYGTEVWNHRR